MILPSFFLPVCAIEKRKLLHKASSCQFKCRLTELQKMICAGIRTSSVKSAGTFPSPKQRPSSPDQNSTYMYRVLDFKGQPEEMAAFSF